MNFLRPYLWRLVFTVLGLITALLFLFIGFPKTMLILICCAIGFGAGSCKDKGIDLIKRILSLRNRW